MSRTLALLDAVAHRLRALNVAAGPMFSDVRVELDRYDLGDLLKESTRAPAARVCFLRGAPARRPSGELDRDVSIAIVVIAKREGRALREVASADAACLDLIEAVSGALADDPYVGLTMLTAAEIGDELVVVSEAAGKSGLAIGLVEAKWRLLQAQPARAPQAIAAGLAPDPRPIIITADGDTIAGGAA